MHTNAAAAIRVKPEVIGEGLNRDGLITPLCVMSMSVRDRGVRLHSKCLLNKALHPQEFQINPENGTQQDRCVKSNKNIKMAPMCLPCPFVMTIK